MQFKRLTFAFETKDQFLWCDHAKYITNDWYKDVLGRILHHCWINVESVQLLHQTFSWKGTGIKEKFWKFSFMQRKDVTKKKSLATWISETVITNNRNTFSTSSCSKVPLQYPLQFIIIYLTNWWMMSKGTAAKTQSGSVESQFTTETILNLSVGCSGSCWSWHANRSNWKGTEREFLHLESTFILFKGKSHAPTGRLVNRW